MFRSGLSINKLLQKTLQSSKKSCNNNNSLIQKKRFSDMSSIPKPDRTVRKRNKAARTAKNTEKKGEGFPILFGSIILSVSAAAYLLHDYYVDTDNSTIKNYFPEFISKACDKLLFSSNKGVDEPYMYKLIPDFPDDPVYMNVPPGTPAQPLLILDVERCCIGMTYTAADGWRYYKRPGLDTFLKQLEQYYEIVLHHETEEIVDATTQLIQSSGQFIHLLGPTHADQRPDGSIRKRLDLMNRPMSTILLIDDDPESFQGFEENTLQIEPMREVDDPLFESDDILLRLIPLLQNMVHHEKKDIPKVLRNLGTRNATQAAEEYEMRKFRIQQANRQKRQGKGLGALVHSSTGAAPAPTAVFPEVDLDDNSKGRIIGETKQKQKLPGETAKRRRTEKKQGGLFAWVERHEQDKMEYEMHRNEKMQEIMQKRAQQQQQQSE